MEARKDKKLSELPIQDSYSYRLANIYTGAGDEKDLLDKYHKIVERLNIDIKEI